LSDTSRDNGPLMLLAHTPGGSGRPPTATDGGTTPESYQRHQILSVYGKIAEILELDNP
jgi:hypothetical protein